MGRVLDWLLYGTPPSNDTPAIRAAAGRVELARRHPRQATTPYGFGPPLAGFEPPYPFDQIAGWLDRDAAMSVASISRSRDLICSAVSQLPITTWTIDRAQVPHLERRIPDIGWAERPDPNRTRQWLLSWTTDDLYFHGVAHWRITDRYATGFPSSFERIPAGDLTESGGTWTYTDPITGQRSAVAERDIVEFLSPIDGLLHMGWRTISVALRLDQAADRFAGAEIPNGWLQQTSEAEDMDADDLEAEALRFSAARYTNTTAAVSKGFEYHPNVVDADALQLVESRGYQALECARQGNVPPYLVGAPAGTGMTYQNGQQARQDLIDFGASSYIGCIEQTLSGPNVTPRGTAVRLDLNAYLRNPFTQGQPENTPPDTPTPAAEVFP